MPDRSDSTQEGPTLSPTSSIRLIAEAAARQVVIEHIKLCPFAGAEVEKRLRTIEMGLARLTGFMVGSGILGGSTAAIVMKLLSP